MYGELRRNSAYVKIWLHARRPGPIRRVAARRFSPPSLHLSGKGREQRSHSTKNTSPETPLVDKVIEFIAIAFFLISAANLNHGTLFESVGFMFIGVAERVVLRHGGALHWHHSGAMVHGLLVMTRLNAESRIDRNSEQPLWGYVESVPRRNPCAHCRVLPICPAPLVQNSSPSHFHHSRLLPSLSFLP